MSFFGSFLKKDSGNHQPGKWRVGDIIANNYEVRQILGGEGKSGMGIVYVCYDRAYELIFALKTFQDRYISSKEFQKFFEREALIWTRLGRHSNIVRAYWVELLAERLFIVLEYIDPDDNHGRNTLTHYLKNLTLPEILKLSIQFCDGMEYVYSKGIDAHRDIKPDNIMITADKTLKISDFGLTKAFQEIEIKEDTISKEKNPSLSIFWSQGKRICGTLPYMAPEQFNGYADKRSDIYSFGIVLYQMVTNGRLPFLARTHEEYEKLHKHEKIRISSSLLSPIIQKCLEKEPDKRYQEFATIREELQHLLIEETGEKLIPPEPLPIEANEFVAKGISSAYLGRHQEAIDCYDEALRIDPKEAGAFSEKGAALQALGRHQEAINCYDEALRIDPNSANAWRQKGAVLNQLEKHQEALTCFDKVLMIEPKDAISWFSKGVVLGKLCRYQEALKCAEKAIEYAEKAIDLDPNFTKQVQALKQFILQISGR